ncbi:DUF4843 domain-containing protein [Sphingobacterium paucimobilis]|uniref:DUF4843 domain-containing protein n=1 Tax=Sphingobacterium paucimobilis HER1398 TaxID=1346330 RepID=U2HE35_9SPHI|nr:DUF4843 domain-containing protein [Sphingobacterium paucimobilis]ERJ60021.1 hypothetical protein M472_14750 [Sphingobacterium paucimobilis HER1398]
MKNFIYTSVLLVFGIFLHSCTKEPLLYQGEDDNSSGIYFYSVATYTPEGIPLSYTDSLSYSFQNDPARFTDYTMNVPVRALGHVSDKDRPFKVQVIGGTAKEGVDFETLKETYIMPAGESTTRIPIKLFRTPILLQKSINIQLQLVEFGDYKLLLPYLLNMGNNKLLDATKFKIGYSEIITEPSHFASPGRDYFGDWSVKKFKILNDLMSWKTSDWRYVNSGGNFYPVATTRFHYAASIFKVYLEEKLQAGTPVYEDDGKTLMQLGPAYLIDYSKL